MKLRTILFWSHLSAGALAGLVILMMSATGVLLTYERQMIDWVDQRQAETHGTDLMPLPIDDLVAIVRSVESEDLAVTLRFKNDPNAAVKASVGRNRDLLLDPYSGKILRDGDSAAEQFFSKVTQIHRWFALSGDSRTTARAVTAYSNLLFLFLLITGIYLWLPKVWNRMIVRTKVFFNPKAKNGKARDFNWHHVFSFWSLIPLFLLVTTATMFYFPSVGKMVFSIYGEQQPERRRGDPASPPPHAADTFLSQQELLTRAMQQIDNRNVTDWKIIAMQISVAPGAPATFRIDRSIGGQPAKQYDLQLDGVDGSVLEWRTFSDASRGSRTRSIIRFLHTGEVLGIIGQTLAGLASLAACLLVWTGLALAWRRLVRPLLAGKQPVHQ